MIKNKTNKKLISSFAMFLISATMLGTATYAWFTMNKEVEVTGMQVKAKAEQGLLINEIADYSDENWDNEATNNQVEGIKLHATSTSNTSTWYVAYSSKSNSSASATSNQESEDLSSGYFTLGSENYITSTETIEATAGTNAQRDIVYVDKDADTTYDNGEGYYVKYTYYLKSSGDEITCSLNANSQSLNIKDVTVEGSSNSTDLNKSLRVVIVANNKAYIFAPLYDTTSAAYYVNAGATATTPLNKTVSQPTSISSIPSVTSNGIPIYVYLYFEGEDINLKTDNITSTLDDLTISFKLELTDNTTAVVDNGIIIQ